MSAYADVPEVQHGTYEVGMTKYRPRSWCLGVQAAFVLIPLALGQIVGLLSATQIAGWYVAGDSLDS